MSLPYTFAVLSGPVPAAYLDANFASLANMSSVVYKSTLPGSVDRPAISKLGDIVDIKDFGAVCDGVTDDYAAVVEALSSGALIVNAHGPVAVSAQIVVPGLVQFGSADLTLKPLGNFNVVRQHGRSTFIGNIDVSGVGGWNSIALEYNGDSYASAGTQFYLEYPTRAVGNLIGVVGSGTATGYGKAISLHADGIAGANVMAVYIDMGVHGFDTACYMNQNSVDHSKWVTGCRINLTVYSSAAALSMNTSSGVDVDGNQFNIQLQCRPLGNTIGFQLAGQINQWNIEPWDWDGGASGTTPAIQLAGSSTSNSLQTVCNPAWVSNLASASRDNVILNSWSGKGLGLGSIWSTHSDGVIAVNLSSLRFDQGQGVRMQQHNGLTDYPVISSDASDNVIIGGSAIAGTVMYYNSPNATGGHYWQVNGVNKFAVDSAGRLYWPGVAGVTNATTITNSNNTAPRTVTMADATGTLAVQVAVPANSATAGATGQFALDDTYLYTWFATSGWKRLNRGATF
jgi:hypothetical protein